MLHIFCCYSLNNDESLVTTGFRWLWKLKFTVPVKIKLKYRTLATVAVRFCVRFSSLEIRSTAVLTRTRLVRFGSVLLRDYFAYAMM